MSNFVNLLDIVYPVGSVFISNNSVSPADSIGGTWTKLDSDTFICCGTPGSTGGDNQRALAITNLPPNVWLTGGTWKALYGNPAAISTLFDKGAELGIEVMRIADKKDDMYSHTPFDNRPKYRAFNIYFRTA